MRRRRGFILLEVMAGLVLLLALVAIAIRTVGAVAAARRETERRQRAIEAAANLMERISALPRDDLTKARLDQLALDPETLAELPTPMLTIDLGPVEEHRLRRVVVAVTWRTASGRRALPARLAAWFGPIGEARK